MSVRAYLAKILIVDDDPEVNDLLHRVLCGMGYRYIETAVYGKEAIKKVKKEAPDLVILDLRLPDINGDEVFHQIKLLNKDTAVIVITGYPESDTAHRMTEEGIADFITKPFDLSYLENVIFKVMVQHDLGKFVKASRRMS